jgi:hypothetical protein
MSFIATPVDIDPDFTYSGPNSNAEKVRYHIQDTDSGRPLLTDAEIAYELVLAGNDILQAALACAETLVARGAHKVTKKNKDRSINYSDLTAQYTKLVEILQAKVQRGDNSYTMPTIGKVADSENYPSAFNPTDLANQDWEA